MLRYLFLAILLCASCALADWSPEILIWQNPPEVSGGTTDAALAVDSLGHVHIVYSHTYRHASNPVIVRTGFSYTQFDAWGNKLVPDIFISDSLDDSGGYPVIRLFGQDSLWAMWVGGGEQPQLHFAQKYVSLDLEGHVLHPAQDFVRTHGPAGDFFLFDTRHDGTVVVADGDGSQMSALYMTVQAPTGHRLMDDEVVFNTRACWGALGFIDHTDSLQFLWRQSYFGEWYAAYTKRIDTRSPFDTTQRANCVPLTPLTAHGPVRIRSIGDSLLALVEGWPGIPYQIALHLFRRDTYEEIAQTYLGGANANVDVMVEDDSTICLMTPADTNQVDGIYLKRFRVPSLEPIQDTLVVSRAPSPALGMRAYAHSTSGTHHLLYIRQVAPTGPGSMQLWYRCSNFVPNTVASPPAVIGEEYALYPNPANGTVILSGPLQRIISMRLFNILGQCVRSYPMTGQGQQRNAISISMEDLPSGTYYLKLQETQHIITKNIQFIR